MASLPISGPGTADREAAITQYRRRAAIYDLELAAFEPVRRRAVARLGLAPGDTVLDLGCGTGLSFELLRAAIGPTGAVIGVEQCESMLALAKGRVARHGWTNVTLVDAPVETADSEVAGRGRLADAALFHFTHDVLQNDAALDNVGRQLRPGAAIVAAGLQWAPPWFWPVNCFVLPAALHSMSSLEGLDRPWQRLERLTDGFEIEPILFGGGFLARGVVSARNSSQGSGTPSSASSARLRSVPPA